MNTRRVKIGRVNRDIRHAQRIARLRAQHQVGGVGEEQSRAGHAELRNPTGGIAIQKISVIPGNKVRRKGRIEGAGGRIDVDIIQVQLPSIGRQRIGAQLRHQPVKGVLIVSAGAGQRPAEPIRKGYGCLRRIEQLLNARKAVGVVGA